MPYQPLGSHEFSLCKILNLNVKRYSSKDIKRLKQQKQIAHKYFTVISWETTQNKILTYFIVCVRKLLAKNAKTIYRWNS